MKKLTIQAMRQLAERHGGTCLSDVYVSSESKLAWQCAKGHQWTATPDNIQHGRWCPECSGHSRLTIDAMHHLAKSRGGKCLSDTYVNNGTPLLWQCAKGHQWPARPGNIQQGKWCPECSGHSRLTIDAMHHLAESRDGKCLSDIYVNNSTPLLWQCAKGHQWAATPSHVRDGTWCPQCSGNVKLTIQHMHRLAESKGGRCLSDIYVSARSKLTWQCAKGHEWKAVPSHIQGGHWCPECAGTTRLTIQEMHRLAESRGGKCLSDTYDNAKTPLQWQCRTGHSWKATASGVKWGTWCPFCVGRGKTIEDLQRLAQERGGKCLSQEFTDSKAHLKWECSEGHQWKAVWSNIQAGQWCPICSTGLGERICREYFSQLFQQPFPKARPKWLTNKRGYQMELDGYCAALGIAFEHQGEQHYSTKAHFLDNDFDLAQRQEDDARKSELCAERGIALVAVPQIPKRLPLEQVRAFIKERIASKGVPLPEGFDTHDVDINNAYRTSGSREMFNHLQHIATEHGGRCLSTCYVNDNTKLLFQCAKGHTWKALPTNIKQDHWCPFCAGRGKTIGDMQILAAQRGGKCLSAAYEGFDTRLLWVCSRGHKWRATPFHIAQGTWCPFCAGHGKTIGDMQILAAQKGGECLSPTYLGASTRLLWLCAEGHQWRAIPSSIQRGTWCPFCAGRGKTIESLQLLAAQHGGKCLSGAYRGMRAKYPWECSEGHQFEAIAGDIAYNGSWCPVCGNRRKGRRKGR